MTDLSNIPTGQLEQMRASNDRTLAAYKASGTRLEAGNAEIDAEIGRRKAEPDYAAWEPKWQAFCDVADWISSKAVEKKTFIRALIAAHDTPLAGEEWTEYQPSKDGVGPVGVSMETYEIEYSAEIKSGGWCKVPIGGPDWFMGKLYRYRPKQTDEARP